MELERPSHLAEETGAQNGVILEKPGIVMNTEVLTNILFHASGTLPGDPPLLRQLQSQELARRSRRDRCFELHDNRLGNAVAGRDWISYLLNLVSAAVPAREVIRHRDDSGIAVPTG